MNLLAVETSTRQFSLAVAKGGKLIKRHSVVMEKILSDSIVPAIDRILKQSAMPLAKLDGFVVGLGPGSFTSLRVGMSTVKALAFATGKPIVGISSLDAIAAGVALEGCDQVCVISDARRGLVYAAIYQMNGKGLKRKTDYLLMPLAGLLDKVNDRTLFVGDGVTLYKDEIIRLYAKASSGHKTGCQALFADEKFWYPKAEQLIELALPRFAKKRFDDVGKLVPMYLYPQDCQVQKRNK